MTDNKPGNGKTGNRKAVTGKSGHGNTPQGDREGQQGQKAQVKRPQEGERKQGNGMSGNGASTPTAFELKDQTLDKERATPAGTPTVAQMLGEMTWVLSQSPAHKHFSIGDLEWMVMPAILLEQFRIFYGDTTPMGFALWASLSGEAEARMQEQVQTGRGGKLRPDDWKSGDRLWLVELVAPFATAENKLQEIMVGDLAQNVFPARKFKLNMMDPENGKMVVKEIGI